jgi:hypothetical protein
MTPITEINDGPAPAAQLTSIREVDAKLRQLERREWWRWLIALLVMVLLTLGLLSLTVSFGRRDMFEEAQLKLAARGLLGIVLLFDVFAIHQQVQISRMRRELSSQIGMLATLEAMKPAAAAEGEASGRREVARCYLDQLLKVKKDGSHTYGRTREISMTGMGVVLPQPLQPGETIALEFPLGPNAPRLSVNAIVRHQQGFHHGLEFVGLTQADADAIRQACEQWTPA